MTTTPPERRPDAEPVHRPGPHWVAVFAAAATWPLIISGGQVTTYRVGMAVPDWPTTFGINMFLYRFSHSSWGVFIEHRHRLLGAAVGMAAVVLALWFAVGERRRWLKAMGFAALLVVIGQGVLGGTRVLWNSTLFAAVHGCSAQLVFGLLVALCVFTGRSWTEARTQPVPIDPCHLRRRALVTLALIYAQIVAGAVLRHYGAGLIVHVLLATSVWGHAAMLVWRVEQNRSIASALVPASRAMAVAVTIQVLLGIAAWWMLRPFDGIARTVTGPQALVRTGHVANGALLLASAVVLVLHAYRHLAPPPCATTNQRLSPRTSLEMVA